MNLFWIFIFYFADGWNGDRFGGAEDVGGESTAGNWEASRGQSGPDPGSRRAQSRCVWWYIAFIKRHFLFLVASKLKRHDFLDIRWNVLRTTSWKTVPSTSLSRRISPSCTWSMKKWRNTTKRPAKLSTLFGLVISCNSKKPRYAPWFHPGDSFFFQSSVFFFLLFSPSHHINFLLLLFFCCFLWISDFIGIFELWTFIVV